MLIRVLLPVVPFGLAAIGFAAGLMTVLMPVLAARHLRHGRVGRSGHATGQSRAGHRNAEGGGNERGEESSVTCQTSVRPQQTRNQRLPSGMVRLLVVGFDEDASLMGITGCDNRAACLFGAAGILRPDEPDKRLGARRRRDRRASPSSAAIVSAARSSMPRKQRKVAVDAVDISRHLFLPKTLFLFSG